MNTWPRHPVIFEVNTWVWLNDLSGKHRRAVDLSTVPEQEWDADLEDDAVRALVGDGDLGRDRPGAVA